MFPEIAHPLHDGGVCSMQLVLQQRGAFNKPRRRLQEMHSRTKKLTFSPLILYPLLHMTWFTQPIITHGDMIYCVNQVMYNKVIVDYCRLL